MVSVVKEGQFRVGIISSYTLSIIFTTGSRWEIQKHVHMRSARYVPYAVPLIREATSECMGNITGSRWEIEKHVHMRSARYVPYAIPLIREATSECMGNITVT